MKQRQIVRNSPTACCLLPSIWPTFDSADESHWFWIDQNETILLVVKFNEIEIVYLDKMLRVWVRPIFPVLWESNVSTFWMTLSNISNKRLILFYLFIHVVCIFTQSNFLPISNNCRWNVCTYASSECAIESKNSFPICTYEQLEWYWKLKRRKNLIK